MLLMGRQSTPSLRQSLAAAPRRWTRPVLASPRRGGARGERRQPSPRRAPGPVPAGGGRPRRPVVPTRCGACARAPRWSGSPARTSCCRPSAAAAACTERFVHVARRGGARAGGRDRTALQPRYHHRARPADGRASHHATTRRVRTCPPIDASATQPPPWPCLTARSASAATTSPSCATATTPHVSGIGARAARSWSWAASAGRIAGAGAGRRQDSGCARSPSRKRELGSPGQGALQLRITVFVAVGFTPAERGSRMGRPNCFNAVLGESGAGIARHVGRRLQLPKNASVETTASSVD